MTVELKHEIFALMTVKQLRKMAQKVDCAVVGYQPRDDLVAHLESSRNATLLALLKQLAGKDLKRLCKQKGLDSRGRRPELIKKLLGRATKEISSGSRSDHASREQDGMQKDRCSLRGSGRRWRRQQLEPADLRFGTSTDQVGFTPAGIAAFSDLRPAAVVRELIQNSLDAALIEAGEPCARVRFQKSSCILNDIPGIDSYRHAFKQAENEHPSSGSARTVITRIKKTLLEKSHDLLSVTDNGVGLNGWRMSALLSDGVSAKAGNASGTFGNGHSVIIPASNLRYVLYGGLTKEGLRFGGGQAVLASHRADGEEYGRSGRGVYLVSFDRGSDGEPFTLAQSESMPPLISSEIKRIGERHGHGAAVIIPAFNNFEHEIPLWEAVSCAAAFNFFQAIKDGLLVVEVEDSEGNGVVDANTLPEVLDRYRNEVRVRSTTGAFLSGRKANEAYEALVNGDPHEIETSQGVVTIRLHCRQTGRQSVGLCRNGMWITDALSTFNKAFSDRQPFQALILLRPDRKNAFYELIQEAETPLHDKLALKQMDSSRRNALQKALREVRDRIRELVPAATDDEYSPEGISAFQFNDMEAQGRGGRQPSYWGQVGSMHRPQMERHRKVKGQPGGPGLGGAGSSQEKSAGQTVVKPIFRIASAPSGDRRRTIHVESEENFEDAELRMFVDEHVDATCDRQTRAQATAVLLSNVTLNGHQIEEDDLVKNDEGIIGAKLGLVKANSRTVIETDYMVPEGAMQLLPGQNFALRIEILSSREATKIGGSANAGDRATVDG